eukprot:9093839-Prorocentrum_lima.AAC.1
MHAVAHQPRVGLQGAADADAVRDSAVADEVVLLHADPWVWPPLTQRQLCWCEEPPCAVRVEH